MIAELSSFITLSKSLIAALKELKELLPDGADKDRITQKVHQAERELALAEAQTAQKLGYELCQCTFPPQIMLFNGQRNVYRCEACHHQIAKSRLSYSSVGKDQQGGFS